MNLRVIYCNHDSASLEVRERIGLATEERFRRAYQELRARFPQSEFVIVSTCNRVEFYFASEDRGGLPTQEEVACFIAEFQQIPLDDFINEMRSETEQEAVEHLFRVAASLDSMVLGEDQIVHQIKNAYQRAADFDAVGPLTHHLFQASMKFAAEVRSRTKLSEGKTSIASVAVGEFGKSIFEKFNDKKVLVLGAGEMAEETLRYLKEDGVGSIVIANRNVERAERLAETWGGSAIPFVQWRDHLKDSDVIVCATGATEPIISKSEFAELRKQHGNRRTLFILDLGAPRDFPAEIGRTDDNVFLYDLSDLKQTCERNRNNRQGEITKAERMLEGATEQFLHEFYHRTTRPVIQQLRETWHAIGRDELDRLYKKLDQASEKDRAQIEQTINRIVNKLLHPPLENIKHQSKHGTPHILLDAVKQLFGLGDSQSSDQSDSY